VNPDSAFRAADTELNAFYASVKKKLEAADLARLETAQRAWIRYLDANCEAETALYAGGSIQPAVHSGCLERTTRARIAELHSVYDTGTR
jgi:uncharacterized protein YecT (DUF1311 family)